MKRFHYIIATILLLSITTVITARSYFITPEFERYTFEMTVEVYDNEIEFKDAVRTHLKENHTNQILAKGVEGLAIWIENGDDCRVILKKPRNARMFDAWGHELGQIGRAHV